MKQKKYISRILIWLGFFSILMVLFISVACKSDVCMWGVLAFDIMMFVGIICYIVTVLLPRKMERDKK